MLDLLDRLYTWIHMAVAIMTGSRATHPPHFLFLVYFLFQGENYLSLLGKRILLLHNYAFDMATVHEDVTWYIQTFYPTDSQ